MFARNVIKLIGGSFVGQLLLFLALPLISRLYIPEQFGVVQAALSILTLQLIVGTFRLEIAVLTVDEEHLDDLFRCAWWITALSGCFILVVCAIVTTFSNFQIGKESLVLVLIPILGVIAGWNQLALYYGLRKLAFGSNASSKILQPIGYSAIAIGAGAIQPSVVGLLISDGVGRTCSLIYLIKVLSINLQRLRFPSMTLLKNTIQSHRELVGMGLLASLVSAAGSGFTALILLWIFGAYEAGQFAMAERLIGAPLALFTSAISQVFIAQLSKAISTSDYNAARIYYRKILRFQVITSFPIYAALFFLVPAVTEFFLGDEWQYVDSYIRALSIFYICSYITNPLNMILTVLGKQRTQLLWDSFRLILAAVTWGGIWLMNFEPVHALWTYSLASIVWYGCFLLFANRAVRDLENMVKGTV